MPYFIHRKGIHRPSENFVAVACTKAEAVDRLAVLLKDDPKLTLTFVASDRERARWQSRETGRFENGTYVSVPWHQELWADVLVDHFAHLAIAKQGCVAYTPDDQAGHEDRQLRLTPGRYLERFAPKLSGDIRDHYCAIVRGFAHQQISWTDDPRTIAQVYKRGPSSCMSGSHFAISDHPCRAYGGPGSTVAVAYLGNPDDHVVARAIVDRSRHEWVRTYGDPLLSELLRRDGFVCVESLTGVRLSVVRDVNDRIRAPYFDGSDRRFDLCMVDGRQTLVQVRGGAYCLDRTDGYLEEPEDDEEACGTCDHCGDPCDEDETYCPGCWDNHVTCMVCDEVAWVDDGDTLRICEPGLNDYAHDLCVNTLRCAYGGCRRCGRITNDRLDLVNFLCAVHGQGAATFCLACGAVLPVVTSEGRCQACVSDDSPIQYRLHDGCFLFPLEDQ